MSVYVFLTNGRLVVISDFVSIKIIYGTVVATGAHTSKIINKMDIKHIDIAPTTTM